MINIFSSQKQKKQFIYTLLFLLALLAVIFMLLSFSKQKQAELVRQAEEAEQMAEQRALTNAAVKLAGTEDTETSDHFVAGDNGLLIEQQEVGNAVIVHTVILEKPGFVVFYSGDKEFSNFSPLLPRGAHRIVSIAAPEKLEQNTTYYVGLHHDSNNNGIYDREDDLVLTNDQGEMLLAEFTAVKNE